MCLKFDRLYSLLLQGYIVKKLDFFAFFVDHKLLRRVCANTNVCRVIYTVSLNRFLAQGCWITIKFSAMFDNLCI